MTTYQIPKKKRGDPWFDDGNIVLLTNQEDVTIAFKVHKSVLARHSDVFKSMFEDAQAPPEAERVDSCPVVQLSDAPADLSHLIKACYDGLGGSLHNRSVDDFMDVAGILQISTKYCIAHLRMEAIRFLAKTWTDTLRGHDEMLEQAIKVEPVNGLSFPFVHPLHVLHLARQTDVRIVIPFALYFLSTYPLKDLLRGDHPKLQTPAKARFSNTLTPQDLQDYTLMYQYRVNAMLDFVRRVCNDRKPTPDCSGGRTCQKAFATLALRMSTEWVARTGPLHYMVQGMDELATYPNACASCRKAFRQDVNGAREELWKGLPTAIGLPPWEDLQKELHAPSP